MDVDKNLVKLSALRYDPNKINEELSRLKMEVGDEEEAEKYYR